MIPPQRPSLLLSSTCHSSHKHLVVQPASTEYPLCAQETDTALSFGDWQQGGNGTSVSDHMNAE